MKKVDPFQCYYKGYLVNLSNEEEGLRQTKEAELREFLHLGSTFNNTPLWITHDFCKGILIHSKDNEGNVDITFTHSAQEALACANEMLGILESAYKRQYNLIQIPRGPSPSRSSAVPASASPPSTSRSVASSDSLTPPRTASPSSASELDHRLFDIPPNSPSPVSSDESFDIPSSTLGDGINQLQTELQTVKAAYLNLIGQVEKQVAKLLKQLQNQSEVIDQRDAAVLRLHDDIQQLEHALLELSRKAVETELALKNQEETNQQLSIELNNLRKYRLTLLDLFQNLKKSYDALRDIENQLRNSNAQKDLIIAQLHQQLLSLNQQLQEAQSIKPLPASDDAEQATAPSSDSDDESPHISAAAKVDSAVQTIIPSTTAASTQTHRSASEIGKTWLIKALRQAKDNQSQQLQAALDTQLNMEQIITELQTQLQAATNKQSLLEQQLCTLTSEKQHLAQQIANLTANYEAKIKQLTQAQEELQKQLTATQTELQQANAAHANKLARLQELQTQRDAEREQFNQQLVALQKQLAQTSNSYTELQQENNELNKKIKTLQDQLEKANHKQDQELQAALGIQTQLKQQIASLQAQLQAAIDKQNQLRHQLSSLNSEKQTLQQQMTALQTTTSDHQTSAAALQQQITQISSEYEKLQEQYKQQQAVIAELKQQLQDSQDKLDAANAQIDQLKLQTIQEINKKIDIEKQLRTEIDQLKAAHEAALNELREREQKLLQEFQAKEQQYNAATTQQQQQLQQIQTQQSQAAQKYQEQVVSLQHQLDQARDELRQLRAQKEQLTLSNSELENKISGLAAQMAQLQAAHETEVQQLKAKEQELQNQLAAAAATHKTETATLNGQLTALQAEMSQLQTAHHRQTQIVQQHADENQRLHQRLQELEQSKQALNELFAEARANNQKLTAELSAVSERMEQSTSKIELALQEYENKNQSLRRKLKKAKDALNKSATKSEMDAFIIQSQTLVQNEDAEALFLITQERDKLHTQLEAATAQLDQLQKAYETLDGELQTRIQNLLANLSKSQGETNSLQQQLKDIQQQLTTANAQITALQEQNAALEEEAATVENVAKMETNTEIEALKKRISRLKKRLMAMNLKRFRRFPGGSISADNPFVDASIGRRPLPNDPLSHLDLAVARFVNPPSPVPVAAPAANHIPPAPAPAPADENAGMYDFINATALAMVDDDGPLALAAASQLLGPQIPIPAIPSAPIPAPNDSSAEFEETMKTMQELSHQAARSGNEKLLSLEHRAEKIQQQAKKWKQIALDAGKKFVQLQHSYNALGAPAEEAHKQAQKLKKKNEELVEELEKMQDELTAAKAANAPIVITQTATPIADETTANQLHEKMRESQNLLAQTKALARNSLHTSEQALQEANEEISSLLKELADLQSKYDQASEYLLRPDVQAFISRGIDVYEERRISMSASLDTSFDTLNLSNSGL